MIYLFWIYVLSALGMFLACLYGTYYDYTRGKDLTLGTFLGAIGVIIVPVFNTIELIRLAIEFSEDFSNFVILKGKKE